ncbi:hypothetical protein ABZ135_27490 [Streptomyces sp. NPDC006339]|uniref:hypothetical protein n=1 Tax=Streptomyces sp. NPDC006339 TaxID=3156755 RepID=UPI0033AC9B77
MVTSSPSYVRLVRASAWYDLVVTAGFMTPWTYPLLADALSLGGGPTGPMTVLYANLMGSVVMVWALLRAVRPLPLYGLFDGVARALFASWQAYALAHGGPRVLWAFLAVEAVLGVVQLAPWLRRKALRNLSGNPLRTRPETP